MACLSPYYARVGERWIPTPCGRCPPCKKRRVDGWVFRLLQEDKVHSVAHFVTLTYDNAHVNISPNGFMTLCKSDFQKYMKRLRKLVPFTKLKYYVAGEYGSKNQRPHFHAIIFGCPKESLFFDAWHVEGSSIGDVHVGAVTGDSIAYCMKYIDKRGIIPSHDRDDRVPEFSMMSKGLGANYLTDAVVKYHNSDISRLYLTNPGGHRIAMPRYYRDRVFSEDVKAEQGSIVELAIGKANSDNYDLYLRMKGNSDLEYSEFLDSQRNAIVSSFYNNNLKTRD